MVNSTISLIIIDDRTVFLRTVAAEHKALADDDYQVLSVSDSLTPNEIIQQELGLPLEARTREPLTDSSYWGEYTNVRAADRGYVGLKQQYDKGSLSTEEFEAQLAQIMVLYAVERWWSKHPETAEWHYYDGSTWVRATPEYTLITSYQLECPSLQGHLVPDVPIYEQGITDYVVLVLVNKERHEYVRPEDDSSYYEMPTLAPVRGLNHFNEMVESHFKERVYDRWEPYLHAALLYTDEDAELAEYVRLNYKLLDNMSGEDCKIFVVENPPQLSLSEIIEYWKELLAFNVYALWSAREWIRTKPYDKAAVYDIAKQMGIRPNQLPCIVFFELTEDEYRRNKNNIIVPIQGDLTRFFREIFSSIQEDDLNSEEMRNSYWNEEHRRKLADIKTKVLSLGTQISSDEDTVTYSFQGQTVFINQPTGAVRLSNFQNVTEEYEGRGDVPLERVQQSWWRRLFGG